MFHVEQIEIMQLPTVHLNGTNAKDLLADNLAAWRAVRAAIDVLRAAAPNGRDYYPQGTEAVGQAIDEHWHRIGRLQSVADEIEAILKHVQKEAKK